MAESTCEKKNWLKTTIHFIFFRVSARSKIDVPFSIQLKWNKKLLSHTKWKKYAKLVLLAYPELASTGGDCPFLFK